MIRHTVVFNLKHAKGSAEEANFLEDALALTEIPGVKAFERLSLPNDDGTYPKLHESVVNYLPGVFALRYPPGIGGRRDVAARAVGSRARRIGANPDARRVGAAQDQAGDAGRAAIASR